jgi:23S rRNA pseudouridine2604 synthase
MCFSLGFKVTRLKRVRIMNVHLGTLPTGQWRYLAENEIEIINNLTAESSNDATALPKVPRKKTVPAKEKKETAPKDGAKKPVSKKELKKKSFKDFRAAGKKRE